MNASSLLKTARMAEREDDNENAIELYQDLLNSFPESSEAKEAKFDLIDLSKKENTPIQPQTNPSKTKKKTATVIDKTKDKQLGLAIGLNLLLAGAGYMYMGKWIVGIFALLLIIGIYATTRTGGVGSAWLIMNLIMGIDMYILFKKNKAKVIEENTKKCPNCAELIQLEAKVCRYCNTSFEESTI